MCRLFAPELIEAIATGKPPAPGALEAVAAHIQRDRTLAGSMNNLPAYASVVLCRKLAWAAAVGPVNLQILEARAHQPTEFTE